MHITHWKLCVRLCSHYIMQPHQRYMASRLFTPSGRVHSLAQCTVSSEEFRQQGWLCRTNYQGQTVKVIGLQGRARNGRKRRESVNLLCHTAPAMRRQPDTAGTKGGRCNQCRVQPIQPILRWSADHLALKSSLFSILCSSTPQQPAGGPPGWIVQQELLAGAVTQQKEHCCDHVSMMLLILSTSRRSAKCAEAEITGTKQKSSSKNCRAIGYYGIL